MADGSITLPKTHRQFTLNSRPVGTDFEAALSLDEVSVPQPGDGQVLLRAIYLSLDPANRLHMDRESYVPVVPLGGPMHGLIIGEVVETRFAGLKVGDIVYGPGNWAEYSATDGAMLTPINPAPGVPLLAYLGPLGPTGWTAWFGLIEVGRPKPGETVLVSAAAGAVGSMVGQIAKNKGCRAVGIASTDAKCDWLTGELGFDAAINYKTADNLSQAIKAACPDGVDIYFENVGGDFLDAALDNINERARIPLCGLIADYNAAEPPCNTHKLEQLLMKRARMEGFLILDFFHRLPEAIAPMAGWLNAGKLTYKIDLVDGMENTLTAFRSLFEGGNTGKLVVKYGDEKSI